MADLSGRSREEVSGLVEPFLAPLFWPDDEHLGGLQAEAERRGLPPISIAPEQGRLLQVLLAAVAARRVLELGTLAGYSATWMARALPDDGRLDSVELDPAHADLAEEWLGRAGLGGRVRVLRGAALAVLPTLAPGYDLAFVDAVKSEYPAYLDHLLRLVRPGGIICADNVRWGGRIADAAVDDADTEGLRTFLRRIAAHPKLRSTVIAAGDGLSVSVVLPQAPAPAS